MRRLAEVHYEGGDLVGLAMRLAETPCGPLYRGNVSPDRELVATLRAFETLMRQLPAVRA